MNTKRIVRWVIVLFLFAALPGMTAALAQGQEPPAKQPLLLVTELGESAAPDYNVYESEPNNTMGQADVMSVNDVMGGDMNYGGDVDFFKFYIYEHGTTILIDTDAQNINSDLDTIVTLYNSAGTEVAYDDDSSGTLDSLRFSVLTPGWWYVKVEDYYGAGGGDWDYYDLIVSTPLLISASAAGLGTGTVAGIPFRSEDILAWSDLNDGQEKWVMLIDGSDVGFTKNVQNLSRGWVGAAGEERHNLVVGFAANVTVTDFEGTVRVVKPWDWMYFNLDQAGSETVISYRVVVTGAGAGLTTAAEKVDAISVDDHWVAASHIDSYISTAGKASVPKSGGGVLAVPDEDALRMQSTPSGWYNTAFFDGSRVTRLAAEDVIGMSYYAPYNDMYLTILGTGNIAGHPVTQKDIFRIDMPGHTWGSLVWNGSVHGWNYNIDAFDYPGGW